MRGRPSRRRGLGSRGPRSLPSAPRGRGNGVRTSSRVARGKVKSKFGKQRRNSWGSHDSDEYDNNIGTSTYGYRQDEDSYSAQRNFFQQLREEKGQKKPKCLLNDEDSLNILEDEDDDDDTSCDGSSNDRSIRKFYETDSDENGDQNLSGNYLSSLDEDEDDADGERFNNKKRHEGYLSYLTSDEEESENEYPNNEEVEIDHLGLVGQKSTHFKKVSWFVDDDPSINPLILPPSSEDLIFPTDLLIKCVGVYEVLRRFDGVLRLTPFLFEDFCSALSCPDQSALIGEIHIQVLKHIWREDESNYTWYTAQDSKDNANILYFFCDALTWPSVLFSFLESSPRFQSVAEIVQKSNYPYNASIKDKLCVLELLTDLSLEGQGIRDNIAAEGFIKYDDRCRICDKLGDLLCCETCSATFHLRCLQPPLDDIPEKDWHCQTCENNKIEGVKDCLSDLEKDGLLFRQEPLGVDRHRRKYWFLVRRIVVEGNDGTWYYSSETQLELLLAELSKERYECRLLSSINQIKNEIIKHMSLTKSITDDCKVQKKSYLEFEDEVLQKVLDIRKEKQTAENSVSASSNLENEDPESKIDQQEKRATLPTAETPDKGVELPYAKRRLAEFQAEREAAEQQLEKSGPRTRAAANLFRLGEDKQEWAGYKNEYTSRYLAMTRQQRNELKDRKRLLSYKISLTTTSEFTWKGPQYGSEHEAVTTLREAFLKLESSVPAPFVHPNWPSHRTSWIRAINMCTLPRDFSMALVVFQSCIKPVLFVSCWHDYLGVPRLMRFTQQEREDRKNAEKQRQKEKKDEEDLMRSEAPTVKTAMFPNCVKNTVWKMKGEEYRVYVLGGWVWTSCHRRARHSNSLLMGLRGVRAKMRLSQEADSAKDSTSPLPDVIDVSEAIIKRTHYPKVTKSQGKLDMLLPYRMYQLQQETKKFIEHQAQVLWELKKEAEEELKSAAQPGKELAAKKTPEAPGAETAAPDDWMRKYFCYSCACARDKLAGNVEGVLLCYSPSCRALHARLLRDDEEKESDKSGEEEDQELGDQESLGEGTPEEDTSLDEGEIGENSSVKTFFSHCDMIRAMEGVTKKDFEVVLISLAKKKKKKKR